MFPRDPHPADRPRAWRDALLRGLDLVVAFATLRDAESPEGDGRDASGGAPAETRGNGAGAVRAAAGRGPEGREGRGGAGGGEGATGSGRAEPRPGRLDPRRSHPHRRTLDAPARARRPGAVRPAAQLCLSPVAPRGDRRAARTAIER